MKRRYDPKRATRVAKLTSALSSAPATLSTITLEDGATWQEQLSLNDDSEGIFAFCEVWGRLMEGELAKGRTVADCATEMSALANVNGFQGEILRFATANLTVFWKHGEALKPFLAPRFVIN